MNCGGGGGVGLYGQGTSGVKPSSTGQPGTGGVVEPMVLLVIIVLMVVSAVVVEEQMMMILILATVEMAMVEKVV